MTKLTAYEIEAIKKSIEEEMQAQYDYEKRAGESTDPKVKKLFRHIKKEELTHQREFEKLLR